MPEPAPHERRPRLPAGAPDAKPPQPPKRRFRPGFIGIVVIALALNYALVNVISPPEPSITVPYSPFFLDQVDANNVKRISPLGETVEGEFKKRVSYEDSDAATQFETEIPQFANGDQLEAMLRQHA